MKYETVFGFGMLRGVSARIKATQDLIAAVQEDSIQKARKALKAGASINCSQLKENLRGCVTPLDIAKSEKMKQFLIKNGGLTDKALGEKIDREVRSLPGWSEQQRQRG